MKSTVETLSPTRVRLSVEVPFEELGEHLTQAYKKVGQQVKVPGFRPGKAPKAVIDQRVGKDAVYAEATDAALPRQLFAAIQENNVRVLGRPSVTDLEPIAEGKPLTFTAEVDVAPEFDLPELGDLEVEVESTDVTDEQIDTEIENLRLRFGTLKTVEREAANGDFVTIDLKATIDGDEVEGGSTTGMSHEVGAGDLLDGLDEALVGMSAGDTKTFSSALAGGDRAGENADVEVKVGSVKERELPELDDDFAQMASEYDTLEELRDSTRDTLASRASNAQGQQVRENTLNALVDSLDLPVPDGAVDEEVENRTEHLRNQLTQMGLDFETYLSAQGQDPDEFAESQRETAAVGLRRQLVLDKVADDSEIQVTAEQLTAEIQRRALQQGVPESQHQQFANVLRDRGLLPGLTAEIRRALALDEVVRAATITDSSGKTLDEETLFPKPVAGDEAGTTDADEASE
ncbi:MAG TPA: trigger factor [Stackebrandtia sp.]|uniref:trigger factor n=1 Tax=Stackebrandtia sp. TaxID=2023065 RepID=UPI002D54FB1A|nr:trigger factor [Stackebrandtia sp.]HZE40541.1 trigger factor [Stackebrandtia sp.]